MRALIPVLLFVCLFAWLDSLYEPPPTQERVDQLEADLNFYKSHCNVADAGTE